MTSLTHWTATMMASVCLWFFAAYTAHSNPQELKVETAQQYDSPGRHSYPLRWDATPAIGNIAGIQLSIPHNYLLAGVHYRGEEVWTRSRATPPPHTFASDIQDFALLLRQSTLQPVRTEQDWADYLAYGRTAHPAADNRWITVGFHPDTYTVNKGSLQQVLAQYMKDEAHWGPFISQDANLHGLKHMVSQKQEKEKSFWGDTDELFYDPATWGTFITCANYHRAVPPYDPLSSCKHLIVVPELNSVAQVHCNKEDLPRWREIELQIKKIARSFVVKGESQ